MRRQSKVLHMSCQTVLPRREEARRYPRLDSVHPKPPRPRLQGQPTATPSSRVDQTGIVPECQTSGIIIQASALERSHVKGNGDRHKDRSLKVGLPILPLLHCFRIVSTVSGGRINTVSLNVFALLPTMILLEVEKEKWQPKQMSSIRIFPQY